MVNETSTSHWRLWVATGCVFIACVWALTVQSDWAQALGVARGETMNLMQHASARDVLARHVASVHEVAFAQPRDGQGKPIKSHSHAYEMYRYLLAPYRVDREPTDEHAYVIALIPSPELLQFVPQVRDRQMVVEIQPSVYLFQGKATGE